MLKSPPLGEQSSKAPIHPGREGSTGTDDVTYDDDEDDAANDGDDDDDDDEAESPSPTYLIKPRASLASEDLLNVLPRPPPGEEGESSGDQGGTSSSPAPSPTGSDKRRSDEKPSSTSSDDSFTKAGPCLKQHVKD